jgi:hypothetical protein
VICTDKKNAEQQNAIFLSLAIKCPSELSKCQSASLACGGLRKTPRQQGTNSDLGLSAFSSRKIVVCLLSTSKSSINHLLIDPETSTSSIINYLLFLFLLSPLFPPRISRDLPSLHPLIPEPLIGDGCHSRKREFLSL